VTLRIPAADPSFTFPCHLRYSCQTGDGNELSNSSEYMKETQEIMFNLKHEGSRKSSSVPMKVNHSNIGVYMNYFIKALIFSFLKAAQNLYVKRGNVSILRP